MILAGNLTQAAEFERTLRQVTYTFRVDVSHMVETITRAARELTRLDFELEVTGMKPHQVDAMMYVRGAMDPDFADTPSGRAARDNYLRAVAVHPRVGPIAAAAFITGWVTHRAPKGQVDPLTWYRLLGDQPVQVSAS